MTHTTRIRIIAIAVALVLVALVSMPGSGTDGDVFVPSRIWPGPAAEVTP